MLTPFCDATVAESTPHLAAPWPEKLEQSEQERSGKSIKKSLQVLKRGDKLSHFQMGL
jgi:hypothetical protein